MHITTDSNTVPRAHSISYAHAHTHTSANTCTYTSVNHIAHFTRLCWILVDM